MIECCVLWLFVQWRRLVIQNTPNKKQNSGVFFHCRRRERATARSRQLKFSSAGTKASYFSHFSFCSWLRQCRFTSCNSHCALLLYYEYTRNRGLFKCLQISANTQCRSLESTLWLSKVLKSYCLLYFFSCRIICLALDVGEEAMSEKRKMEPEIERKQAIDACSLAYKMYYRYRTAGH